MTSLLAVKSKKKREREISATTMVRNHFRLRCTNLSKRDILPAIMQVKTRSFADTR